MRQWSGRNCLRRRTVTVPAVFKTAGLAACALAGIQISGCAVRMAGEPAEGPLRTNRLEIVDDMGVARITLGDVDIGQSPGAFGMELNDPEGRSLFVLGVHADGSQVLSMKDPRGGAFRVQVVASAGGTIEFVMSDRDGRPRIRLRVMPEGAARVSILDEGGSVAEEMRTKAE